MVSTTGSMKFTYAERSKSARGGATGSINSASSNITIRSMLAPARAPKQHPPPSCHTAPRVTYGVATRCIISVNKSSSSTSSISAPTKTRTILPINDTMPYPPPRALAMASFFVADAPIFRSVQPQQGYGRGIRHRQSRIAFSRDGHSGPRLTTCTRTATNRITEYLVGRRLQMTSAVVPF